MNVLTIAPENLLKLEIILLLGQNLKTHKKFKNQKNTNYVFWNKYQLISHIRWLIDNIYVVCGKSLFKQKIGIPMGTDCAPFLANLFLYSYEYNWLKDKQKEKKFDFLKKFKYCFRYLDDLLCINNDQTMDSIMQDIYPQELKLESDYGITKTHYLDLDLEIVNGKIDYKLYDKRDTFGFSIVNFPNLSGNIPKKESYGVFISQLIRYARCCKYFKHFVERSKLLITKLLSQGFILKLLKKAFKKFIIL